MDAGERVELPNEHAACCAQKSTSHDDGVRRMTKVFYVKRVAPAHCPACDAAFSASEVFAPHAPAHGSSFVQALTEAHTRFPEVFGAGVAPASQTADFMRCSGCGNITLRLILRERLVRTREEAERLVEDGYTAFSEVEALGDAEHGVDSGNAPSDRGDA